MQIDLGPLPACRRRRRLRRGTTTVEFALIALPLILFIFASIEFGRAMMAMQTLEESARAGCRTAILGGATVQNVETAVDDALSGSGIRNYTVDVNPTSLESMQRWAPVTVRVTTTYDEFSWLPSPMYFKSMTYSASCTLPREAGEDS